MQCLLGLSGDGAVCPAEVGNVRHFHKEPGVHHSRHAAQAGVDDLSQWCKFEFSAKIGKFTQTTLWENFSVKGCVIRVY